MLQMTDLLLQQLKPVFHLKRFFQGKYYSGKLQEVVTDSLGKIKACIPENASQAHQVWCVFSGKVHEFHVHLL